MNAALVLSAMLLAAPGPSLLVLDAEVRGGVPADTGHVIVELLQVRMKNAGRYARVSSMADLRTTVDVERQRMLTACTDEGCLAEMGRALDADLLLLSSVSRVGDTYTLTVRLFDARTGRVDAAATRTVPREGDLVAALPELADELLHGPPAADTRARAAQGTTAPGTVETLAPARYASAAFVVVNALAHGCTLCGVAGWTSTFALFPLVGLCPAGMLPAVVGSTMAFLAWPAALLLGGVSTVLTALFGRGRANALDRVLLGSATVAQAVTAAVSLVGAVGGAVGFFAIVVLLAAAGEPVNTVNPDAISSGSADAFAGMSMPGRAAFGLAMASCAAFPALGGLACLSSVGAGLSGASLGIGTLEPGEPVVTGDKGTTPPP